MAGLALILSFALLCGRRTGLMLSLSSAQALAVSVALAARYDVLAAGLNAVSSGLAVPFLLHRRVRPDGMGHRVGAYQWGMPLTLAAGATLTLLATSVDILAVPLAIMLLGLLTLATRHDPIWRALGLCSMQQAALLVVAGRDPGPAWLSAGLAMPILPALALAGVMLGQMAASE